MAIEAHKARGARSRSATLFALAACLVVACGGDAEQSAAEARQRAAALGPFVPEGFTAAEVGAVLTYSPVPAPPADSTNKFAGDPNAALLGQHLFFDRRLSKNGQTACATCHDPRDSFVDLDPLATGVLPLERHTPSLWNVAHQRWFFWDGRADSLWAQALIPLESPLEHAFTRSEVVRVVYEDTALRALYEGVFGDLPQMDDKRRFPAWSRPVPADDHAHLLAEQHALQAADKGNDGRPSRTHQHRTEEGATGSDWIHPHQRAWDWMHPVDQQSVTRAFVNVGKALAAYQRKIVSRHAPFDVFVEGLREHDPVKVAALDVAQQRGLRLFLGRAQCASCHHGALFSDYEFHDTRVPGEPLTDPGRSRGIEAVRAYEFGASSKWSDDPEGPAREKVDFLPVHVHGGREFKTPSLRNVELTPPYMHNGSLATLEAVIDFYADRANVAPDTGGGERILAKPMDLSPEERADLVAFLKALTDDSLDPALRSRP
jgi:cytochrome c peroxidase